MRRIVVGAMLLAAWLVAVGLVAAYQPNLIPVAIGSFYMGLLMSGGR